MVLQRTQQVLLFKRYRKRDITRRALAALGGERQGAMTNREAARRVGRDVKAVRRPDPRTPFSYQRD
jgi:hypothetical protein